MNQTKRIPGSCFVRVGFVLFALLFSGAGISDGARLLGIRTGPRAEGVRVVFDLEGKVPCSLQRGSDGTWSVLLKNLCPGTAPHSIANPHPLLTSIDTRCAGGDVRVDLKSASPLTATALRVPADASKPERYVVDLSPAPQKDSPKAPTAGRDSASVVPGPRQPSAPVDPEPFPRHSGKWRILVDPGHGGNDPGASRKGIQEKDIVLDIARRAAGMLNGTEAFEARLSRDSDRLVPLRKRFAAAEDFDADAFVSIHVNASKTRTAYGVEVFFLSLGGASDEASKELAVLENEADPDYVVEEDSLLQGIPFSFDLRQSDTILRSSRLAESVLGSFEKGNLAASRGVKQAGFAVLKSFQVPSILVETGFISNPDEARRLKDPQHRERLAACIVSGISAYFEKFARARTETKGEP
jgi:N-acetylmuramoyl-L-alanine amidase